MDSSFHGRISQQTKHQICNLLHCQKLAIKVNAFPVKQQDDGVDCGVFAVSFIQHILCFNENPVAVKCDQTQRQRHVLDAVQHNKLNLFPKLVDSA